uniref:Uncharacterized protein n=1 Tax=Setaria italica TaxID=4555 RepID=K4AP03_SETIT
MNVWSIILQGIVRQLRNLMKRRRYNMCMIG